MAINPRGSKIVLNDANTYGKNEFKLYNTITEESIPLMKARKYDFLSDDALLIQGDSLVRFQNLQKKTITDIKGNPVVKILKKSHYVLLYHRKDHLLTFHDQHGIKIWEHSPVDLFDINENDLNVTYHSQGQLVRTTLAGKDAKKTNIKGDVVWLRKSADTITYAYSGNGNSGTLWTVNMDFTRCSSAEIPYPQGFTLSEYSNDYLEVRENRFLILPLMKNRPESDKGKPNIIISYTNRNTAQALDSPQLGIYDLKEKRWAWQPEAAETHPREIFLNEKGDFILFDPTQDSVENESNPLAKITLVTEYGRYKHDLGVLRTEFANYYWDASTGSFLYFLNGKWYCYHTQTLYTHELMKIPGQQWMSDDKNGLTDLPHEAIIPTTEKSQVIVTGDYDLFMVDLAMHTIKKLTHGQALDTQYRIANARTDLTGWNIRTTSIDMKKEVMLKIFNTRNYYSGFARLYRKNVNTIIYEDTSYKDLISTERYTFAIAHSLLKPLTIRKITGKNSYPVFDNSTFVSKQTEGIRKELFQYHTSTGIHNGILLFPKNYQPGKKYPMVVNVYENQTRAALNYSIPNLRSATGFSFMHYVFQNYFVLLPDLEYETGNLRKKILASLSACVEEALKLGNIDRQNIAITGMSYGGYETALALSGSSLFKTGSAGVMISDLVSAALYQSQSMRYPNYQRVERYQMRMGESLFDNWNNYLEQSPIFHLKEMTKPILLWTGLKDDNVPPEQTKSYFIGLKRLSKRAILIEYSDEGHQISNLESKEDLNIRTWQWMEHFLKDTPPPVWIMPILKKAP